MAGKDPIIVAPQNRQEQAGLDALRPYLRPWRCTFVDQRDDFGRDGFVQIVDADCEGTHSLSPLTFALQCKTEAKSLSDTCTDSVQTRHLALWAHEFASPLILALWSVADGMFRFRSAHDVADELDRTTPMWREQKYVSIPYRSHHGHPTAAEALTELRRTVQHELDRRGGVETYHSTRRRVVLTAMLPLGTVSTSDTITLTGMNDSKLVVGEGWVKGDIDCYEVVAQHVLAASLLLYEEVWLPFVCLRTCLDLLGDRLVFDLLNRNRLRPYGANQSLGFLCMSGAVTGRLTNFHIQAEDSISARLSAVLRPNQLAHLKELRAAVVLPPGVDAERIRDETVADIRKPNVRSLLGLRPHIADEEPYWDAQLVNRMASMNLSSSIAGAVRADAIQFESGLSRLSSEKYYHSHGLNRQFATTTAFDSVLRSTGVPDLGQLTQRISIQDLCSLAETAQARDFRDWFWSAAAGLVGTGASITNAFLGQVADLVAQDMRAYSLPVELKLRHLTSFGPQGMLEPFAEHKPAFTTTCSNGDDAALRQRRNWSSFRTKCIRSAGFSPEPYDQCPCKSGEKFRFCCGRPAAKL